MTYPVVWSDEAFTAAESYLVDDRAGLAAVFDAVDELGQEPDPATAFVWGPDLRRLRVGRYRVVYTSPESSGVIEIVHLGRGL